jgi:hypothetical protein
MVTLLKVRLAVAERPWAESASGSRRERAARRRRHLGTYSLLSKNPGNHEARHKKDATPVVVCSWSID